MITGFFNPAKVKEFVEVYLSPNKPKYPDFVKKIDTLVAGTGDHISYSIYEVPDDKIYESIKALNKRYTFYASKMEGYEYNIELVGTMEEAIASLK